LPCGELTHPSCHPVFPNAVHQLISASGATCADHPCESCHRLALVKIHSGSETESKKKHSSSALCFLKKFFIATADTRHTTQVRPGKRIYADEGITWIPYLHQDFPTSLPTSYSFTWPGSNAFPSPAAVTACSQPQPDSTGESVSAEVLSRAFMREDQLKSFQKEISRLGPDLC